MNFPAEPNWLQRRLAIRGYKHRLAGRLRREYGIQDSYLPEQVEFCARHEFAVRRFGVVDWFAPQFLGYAFALFCDKATVQEDYPGVYPDSVWEGLRNAVHGIEYAALTTPSPVFSLPDMPSGDHSGAGAGTIDSSSGAEHQ